MLCYYHTDLKARGSIFRSCRVSKFELKLNAGSIIRFSDCGNILCFLPLPTMWVQWWPIIQSTYHLIEHCACTVTCWATGLHTVKILMQRFCDNCVACWQHQSACRRRLWSHWLWDINITPIYTVGWPAWKVMEVVVLKIFVNSFTFHCKSFITQNKL